MKILFLTRDFSGASLCRRLVLEGHAVRALVYDPAYAHTLDGIVKKVTDLDKGLAWLGRDGLVVADDVGIGVLQDDLRRQGYSVVGGSAGGDRLELERGWAQEIFASVGMKTVPCHDFPCPRDAIAYLRANPAKWVVKGNGHADRTLAYVGKLDGAEDAIDLLDHYACAGGDCRPITLQRAIQGVEVAVARYFNGHDWVGSIALSQEHKHLFPGGIGPLTCEMGTLMWYDDTGDSRLFAETLALLGPTLQKVNFRGIIDLNCIVNADGAHPLEATARFGYPATQLQMQLSRSPWGDFLKAIADGHDYSLEVRSGFGVVILLAVPPFPWGYSGAPASSRGLTIHFREPLSDAERLRLHFEGVRCRIGADGRESFVLCEDIGYAAHVTGSGPTVEQAQEAACALAEKIVIPRMYYRSDIGQRFLDRDRALLEEWGYL